MILTPVSPRPDPSPLKTLLPGDAIEIPNRRALSHLPRYALCLEAHATCTPLCVRWRDCPGLRRAQAGSPRGSQLEEALEADLRLLAGRHPQGFAIRLHRLGDFYDLHYLRRWAAWLEAIPGLHAFGATAWSPESDIGDGVLTLRIAFPARWWLRFSVCTPPCSAATQPGLPLTQAPAGRLAPRPADAIAPIDMAGGAALAHLIIQRGTYDRGPREPRGCRFIQGDTAGDDWRYCQQPQETGSAYCARHRTATRKTPRAPAP